MKVGVFRTGDSAQDFYRAHLPIQTAVEAKMAESSEIWMGNILYEASFRTEEFTKSMSQDVYLIQRLATRQFMDKIKDFIKDSNLKTKIVIDHDDDVFNVSPMSNHYGKYGSEECKIFSKGELVYEWKDGVNMDLKANLRILDQFKCTIESADMLTVTTEGLKKSFSQYNDNIKVLPNCVDLTQWNKLDIRRKNPNEIRIGWYGGNSHWEDLFLIKDVLKEIGHKYPNVKIVMIGYKPMKMENDYREGQLEFHDWVEMAAHPYRLAALDIDIGVIPLKETAFNSAKSPLKLIEFSSLEIPCVTSYVTPYKEVADSDGESGIFIEDNNLDNWWKGIESLIESVELRKRIGKKAREMVKQNFDINTQYKQWINAYEEVLNVDSRKSCIA